MILIYNSTRNYCAVVIKKLMEQCGITIWDIEKVVNDIKYEGRKQGCHDVEEHSKDEEEDASTA